MYWTIRKKDSSLIVQDGTMVEDFEVGIGHVFEPSESLYIYRNNRDNVEKIKTAKDTIIYPPFSKVDHLFAKVGRKTYKMKCKVWLVTRRSEFQAARDLIDSCHYLQAPNRGTVLACKVLSNNLPVLNKKYNSEVNPNIGYLSGCVFIDRLLFGNPTGRRSIFNAQKESEYYLDKSRAEIVNQLGIAWISRVAIVPELRRLGLATLLCKYALLVARKFREPPANWIEVIRTVDTRHIRRIIGPDGDFLTRAGFKIHDHKRLRYLNKYDKVQQTYGEYIKLYYYARSKHK